MQLSRGHSRNSGCGTLRQNGAAPARQRHLAGRWRPRADRQHRRTAGKTTDSRAMDGARHTVGHGGCAAGRNARPRRAGSDCPFGRLFGAQATAVARVRGRAAVQHDGRGRPATARCIDALGACTRHCRDWRRDRVACVQRSVADTRRRHKASCRRRAVAPHRGRGNPR